jgi:hypothetical protein
MKSDFTLAMFHPKTTMKKPTQKNLIVGSKFSGLFKAKN